MNCANPHITTSVGPTPFAPTLSPATQARLAHPAVPGQRHAQIVQIAAALIGQGFNAEAVFWQIRPNYGPDVTDSEIRSVIVWAISRITVNGTDKPKSPRFVNRSRHYGNHPFSPCFPISSETPDWPKTPVSDTVYGTEKRPVLDTAIGSVYGNTDSPKRKSPVITAENAPQSPEKTDVYRKPLPQNHGFGSGIVFRNSGIAATDTVKPPVFPFSETATAPFPQPQTTAPATVTAAVSAAGIPQNRPFPKPLSAPQPPVFAVKSAGNTAPFPLLAGKPLPQNTVGTIASETAFATATGNRLAYASQTASENTPVTAIERFLGGFRCEEYDLWECSQIRPADNWETDAVTVIAALFRSDENVNIVSRFAVNDGKARPHGYGVTQNRETWLAEIARNGPPKSASGVWMRPNPTDGNGISDANVTAYRFLLVEFDAIPLSLQIAFIARLPLPIAAIITSGGKSVHAWIAVNAANATDYRAVTARIFATLAPFGVDTANKNPARLSRLPGVIREIGTVTGTDNRQRLLYLNPEPKAERIIA